MIRIKDLANGYTIEYDEKGFMEQFHLVKDGDTIKESDKQSELEAYLERISKAENKFKIPIKAFTFSTYGYGGDKHFETGVITSANIPDESFWFANDDKQTYHSRRKEKMGGKYYELTKENQFKISQIQERLAVIKTLEKEIADIANTFEKQITKDYITLKQGGK